MNVNDKEDLDRPYHGFLETNVQPMIDLNEKLQASK